MMINAIGITLGIVGVADQLEEIIITNLNKSIEDWMEKELQVVYNKQ